MFAAEDFQNAGGPEHGDPQGPHSIKTAKRRNLDVTVAWTCHYKHAKDRDATTYSCIYSLAPLQPRASSAPG